MRSEETAVLRIVYKHGGPIKLSTLIEGFPDHSKSLIVDAVSRLQLMSFLSVTDCYLELYVCINRHMRRTVLELLEDDSERYNANRIMEKEIQQSHPIPLKQNNTRKDNSYELDLRKLLGTDLWRRLPQKTLILSTILVFSFVFIGSITIMNSQSTTSSSSFADYDKGTPYMFASSSSLVSDMQKGKTVPVENIYNSELNQGYSTGSTIYEGVFTKFGSEQSTSNDDPPMYYHYIISEEKGLLLLEQIRLVGPTSDLNSSLSTISDDHAKDTSST
jgi:hypothetical protein